MTGCIPALNRCVIDDNTSMAQLLTACTYMTLYNLWFSPHISCTKITCTCQNWDRLWAMKHGINKHVWGFLQSSGSLDYCEQPMHSVQTPTSQCITGTTVCRISLRLWVPRDTRKMVWQTFQHFNRNMYLVQYQMLAKCTCTSQIMLTFLTYQSTV